MKKYGIEIIDRPKIKPIKKLDLSGKNGEEIIKLLTEELAKLLSQPTQL